MKAREAADLSTTRDKLIRNVMTSKEKCNEVKTLLDHKIMKTCMAGEYSMEEYFPTFEKETIKEVAKQLRANGYKVRLPWIYPNPPILSFRVKISWAHHRS